MISQTASLWLGYRLAGGRLELRKSAIRNSAVILGDGAEVVTANLVLSLVESGTRIAVVDVCGDLAAALSGYLDVYGPAEVMRESLSLESNGQLHARLLGSAYSTVLNLSPAQEDMLVAAAQGIALEEGEASPMGVIPAIAVVEGFRETEKAEVAGRLSTLRFMESSGEMGAIRRLLQTSFMIDFSKSLTGDLAGVSAAAFLAKIISMDLSALPEFIVVYGAERLFGKDLVPKHSGYLRASLARAGLGVVYSSPSGEVLDRLIVERCPLRIWSGALWNKTNRDPRALSNMFVLEDFGNHSVEAFVPREFEARARQETRANAPILVNADMERKILELIASSESCTRLSVTGFLSSEYPSKAVAECVDSLLKDGCIAFFRLASDRNSFTTKLVLTEIGRRRQTELRKSGEDSDSE